MAIALLQEYVAEFQTRRKQVSDDVLRQYTTPRKLDWKGNPNPNPQAKEAKKGKSKEGEKDKPKS
jgi:tryptophanyl-tRNA synthetase